MRLRLKWSETEDVVIEMANLPREGEFISVRELTDATTRYKVTFVEHLVDVVRADGRPLSGVVALVWCKLYPPKA